MSKKTTVNIGSALDIMHVSTLKERLFKASAKNLPVVLVCDKVEKADTAGLQLIYAFIRQIENQGHQVSWQKPSEILIQVSQALGMQQALYLS